VRHSTAIPFVPRIALPVLALILVAPWAVYFYWPVNWVMDIQDHQIGRDFINVWVGPQLAFGGRLETLFSIYGYHSAINQIFDQALPLHNWSYPLFALPVFWPLAQLPYLVALAIWTAALLAVFSAVALSQVDREFRVYALFALIAAPASVINILSGQNGFLSGALLLGGILLIDRRPVVAGILFGLLTFKPQLGIVLPFALLALGAWRTIAAAAVTTLALVAMSVAFFGIDAWRSYFAVTGAYQFELMESFYGFYTAMMMSVLAAGRTLGFSYTVSFVAQAVVSLAVLAAACWAVRQTADAQKRAFVLVIASLLITPYSFNYDFTALTAILVWKLCSPWPEDWGRRALYALTYFSPVLLMYLNAVNLAFMPGLLVVLFAIAIQEAAEDRVVVPNKVVAHA
jgi:hypothetical protein